MLQTIRDRLQGVIASGIVGFLVVIFALWGVEALVQGRAASHHDAIATVNGKDVTELDVRRGMEMRKRQIEAMLGGKADPQFLTDEFLRKPVEDGLVRRRVLESAADDNHLSVADAVIDREIVTDKTFQMNGKFDRDHYKYLLAQAGYTPATYREELKREYLLNQLQDSLLHTAFVTGKEADELARLQNEKRSFEYAQLSLAKAMASATASDDEIKAYYDKHKDQFLSEDRVSVDYLELNRDLLGLEKKVTDEDIQKQYDAETAAVKDKVTRHAAHILIEEKPDGSHEATLKAIEEKLAKGEDFAALAKQYSADTVSAEKGGDVGETTGDSFVPEFEDALKKLAVGQVSAPVKSKFGYHLIKLLDEKQPKIETLQEAHPRIAADLRKQQGTELYGEKIEVLRDEAKANTPLADILGKLALNLPIQVQHRDDLTRREVMMQFRARNVADALFADGMGAGKLTDVIEPQEGHAVLFRITDRKLPGVQTLDQVRTQVSDAVRRDKATAALAAQAQTLREKVAAGDSLEKLVPSVQAEWKHAADKLRNDSGVDSDVLKQAFAMAVPAPGHPSLDTVSLASGDVVVLNLQAVATPAAAELGDEQKAKVRDELQSSVASHEFAAFESLLETSARITRKKAPAP